MSNGNGQILFRYYGNVLSMSQATATSDGWLSKIDWNRFNNTALGTSPVQSVFGRIGAVVAIPSDYAAFYPSLAGSYANPSWISSLAYGKITGAPPPPTTFSFVNSVRHVASTAPSPDVIDLLGDIPIPPASQYYGTDPSATRGWFDLPTAANAYTELWSWTNKTSDADNSGQVGNNASTWDAATAVNINQTTKGGRDMTIAFQALFVKGNAILLQQKNNSANWGYYSITDDPIDHGVWWEFPAAIINSGGTTPTSSDTIVTVIVKGGGSAPPPSGDGGITVQGTVALISGQSYITVSFPSAQPDTTWHLAWHIFNVVDASALNIIGGTLTAKTIHGFTMLLNGTPDSGNYFLRWGVIGGAPPAVATTYLLSGPSSGMTGVPSAPFTVSLPVGTAGSGTMTVTPHDGGAGGTFTPSTVTLTTGAPSATFTYTPSSTGAKTISVTNDKGLTDPSSLTYTAAAGTYLLTGPSGGQSGIASTNFTVDLGGTVVAGTVTVTPSDAGAGGIFTPTSVGLTNASPSHTFTYTPSSTGAKTISTTNDHLLTDPASLSYNATAGTYSFSGPSGGTSGVASTNFTVALTGGSLVPGTMTVTPHDGGAGGTFTPATVTLTTAAPSTTFTYTPSSAGAKTLSVTNDKSFTDPGNLTYTATSGALADGDPVNSWPDSSGNGHTATMTGSNRPIYKTAIVGGKPVVRFTSAGLSGLNLASAISAASPYEMFSVTKRAATGSKIVTLGCSTNGTPYTTYIDGGTGNILAIATTTDIGYVTPLPFSVAWHIIDGSISGSAAGLYVDGAPVGLTFFAAANAGNFDNLGYKGGDSTYSDADIAEIIIYSGTLSTTDRLNVTKYLSDKYGFGIGGGTAVDPSTVSGLLGWWKADAPPT